MINNVSYAHEKRWGKALANLMTTALMSAALISCGGEGGGGASSDIPGGLGGDHPTMTNSGGFSSICASGNATAEQSYTLDRLFESLKLQRGIDSCAMAYREINNARIVNLRATGIMDVSVLSDLPQVEMMLLSGNLIDEVRELRDLPSLARLDLSHNPISNVPDLRSFSNLNTLNLAATAITSLNGIEGLSTVETLTMGQTAVTDWSRLAQLPKLSTIKLANLNKPESLATLPAGSFTALIIPDNGLTEITSIVEKMPNLKHLDVEENQLTSVNVVASLNQLEALVARDNKITSVSEGVLPATMRYLTLAANPIEDFGFLRQLRDVAVLDLSSTPLTTIDPIRHLFPKAVDMYLRDTRITALSFDGPMANWTYMEELDLSNTDISSLEPLKRVEASLTSFSAYGTPAIASKDAAACPTQDAPQAVQFFCVNGYSR